MKIKEIVILLVLILLLSVPIYAENPTVSENFINMELVTQNDYLSLYINRSTTEIAVLDNESGDVWYSNPPDFDNNEKIARGATKARMQSQIVIGYYRSSEATSQTDPATVSNLALMDSFQDSVSYGQFEIKQLEDGIKVVYDFGEKWDYSDYIPMVIDEESFEKLMSNIDNTMDRNRLKKYYIAYSFVKDGAKDRVKIAQLDQDKLFGDHSIVMHDEEYQRKLREFEELEAKAANFVGSEEEKKEFEDQLRIAKTKIKSSKSGMIWSLIHAITENRISMPAAGDLTSEDFDIFYGKTIYVYQPAPVFMAKKFADSIKNAGFTPEDIVDIHQKNSIDPPIPNVDVFTIPIEYRLENENFVVNVPTEEIEYPKDAFHIPLTGANIEFAVKPIKVTRPLNYINVLPYFGSASIKEKGYMFVPDGSGALIKFNNGKTNINQYMAQVYGRDYAIAPQQNKKYSSKNIHLPVFGLKKESSAFMGIIEDGAGIARIKSDISEKNSSYNTISTEFVTMPVTNVGFGSSVAHSDKGVGTERTSAVEDNMTKVTVFQDRIYQGDIKIRYAFLHGDRADYVGMASYYRDYLMKKNGIDKVSKNDKIPFYLELIGAIPVRKPVLGINMEVFEPLTSFEQADQIINELEAEGIGNIRIKYSGIINGGLDQGYPSAFNVTGKLGGKKGLLDLYDRIKRDDYQLYPEISFMNIYRDGLFDGFNPEDQSSRFFNRYPAKIYEYNSATFEIIPDQFRYLLSPRKIDSLTSKFLESYQNYGINNLSFAFLGNQVYSDFRDEDDGLVDREQARDIFVQQLKKFDEHGYNIMVNGGDDYTLPYTRDVLNIPMDSSKHNLTDKDVPFAQIALHGIVSFAGSPINLAEDNRRAILKTIETGGYPYYKWFYRESSIVKDTKYDYLYTCDYSNWIEDAQSFYQESNEVLNSVQDKFIINHEELMEDVYRTSYEDGTIVIVNYNQDPVEIDGLEIDGFNYKMQRR